MSENRTVALWLRAAVAAALYVMAAFMLSLSLSAMGREVNPTTDRDFVAGANLCLALSTVFLAATAVVARRWKAAWALWLPHLVATALVWTQVPSLF
ncbi:hypothetical protein AR457_08030 [Streptomyces agglomeratus]|uniref:DUF202 domain-containing protein n=1 Tax=Streptomyces agglomeratus TaxID=285458 RepID=A0A1E5P4L3_9ACTN|nr:hypothetical protein [Streptomyces agglomeratus]OEJ24486.1 hypothetical protein AS594_08270 [Streptomyces agglomeratus]OEJ41563.1 hypothetical protein BGK70_28620 [Streptomyces agglomeratus]OEJ44059.1 hypothetical protein AR457_08030 [Streptomyces agglomeratus]OEJ54053.1 hypothetical protein BGK72_27915 [Streptomyces agglomeratus]OEJ61426.1 hypothetical protein BGM19_28840 [Streptomyces agglomeratus]